MTPDITMLLLLRHSWSLTRSETSGSISLPQKRLSLQVREDYPALVDACCQTLEPAPRSAQRHAFCHHPNLGQGPCLGPLV